MSSWDGIIIEWSLKASLKGKSLVMLLFMLEKNFNIITRIQSKSKEEAEIV
tara:strand:- start:510 stop:662 length:153 start_codon:yes stop_codon:yes gene_type:complete